MPQIRLTIHLDFKWPGDAEHNAAPIMELHEAGRKAMEQITSNVSQKSRYPLMQAGVNVGLISEGKDVGIENTANRT